MHYREIMQDFSSSFSLAFALIFQFDAELLEIIGLSLRVSVSAVVISTMIGLPLGAAIAVMRFRGRRLIDILLNALMGLPWLIPICSSAITSWRTDPVMPDSKYPTS